MACFTTDAPTSEALKRGELALYREKLLNLSLYVMGREELIYKMEQVAETVILKEMFAFFYFF